MPELNADTPFLYTNLRAEYLYNGEKGQGELIPCCLFGVSSIPGRALLFHAMLDNGALIYRLPISAFAAKPDAPHIPVHLLQLWDCFSDQVSVLEFAYLRGLRVDVTLRDRTIHPGVYQFTVDWHGSATADGVGDGGHKCAHIIALENGCYAAQPNNRLRWYEPSFIVQPFPERPDYQTNRRLWSVENKGPKWMTEDSDRLFYDVEPV